MQTNIPKLISTELSISIKQVQNTVDLLNADATVPFIARYRKEKTGNLDEEQILEIKNKLAFYSDLEKRKIYILDKIESEGKLTDSLKELITNTYNSQSLEDLYLPFKSKRKTKAAVARENGLEPLAKQIMSQNSNDLDYLAGKYLSENIQSIEDALEGARQIIAEWINENTWVRDVLRDAFEKYSRISSKLVKGKEQEAEKYRDYFDFSESSSRIPSHRFLAISRAANAGLLKVSVDFDSEYSLEKIKRRYLKANNESSTQVSLSIDDAFKRLLKPSLENELLGKLKEKADESAISVFKKNLTQLLLDSPLGQKRILALDPGFRTGCKVVCINEFGDLLHNVTIYPHAPQNELKQASSKVYNLVETYKIQAIAIGNGTAGRETESFIKRLKLKLPVFMVSEDGASVYSASKIAREEFPSYDVTVRGAVSIGRRLMDPLAELVKIDPKSIGVGQYQHEVNQSKLQTALEDTTILAVNNVGVNLNTASKHILSFVSGLGPALAQNIVEYRSENGSFKNRKELLKVARLGNKAYEQAAGFLRIKDGNNPLDNSGIHPETYPVVEKIAKDNKVAISELISNTTLLSSIDFKNYITDQVGLETLRDIKKELLKPGLDPRSILQEIKFNEDILKIQDLKVGMTLPGKISNITNFGAFVDLGIKENGLVHLSNMADRFIADPNEVVSLGQHVSVEVISVEVEKKRIGLKLKN